MLTRKHFIKTANILNQCYLENPELINNIAKDFAVFFKQENNLFNVTKFLEAVKKEY